MLTAVTPRDIYDITKLQRFLALRGDTLAAREVLDHCIGKAVSVTEMIVLESASRVRVDRGAAEAELQLMDDSVPMFPPETAAEEREKGSSQESVG